MPDPIVLTTPTIEARFSGVTGFLEHLAPRGEDGILTPAAEAPSFDVRLGREGWLGQGHRPVLIDHSADGGWSLVFRLGPIVVRDQYDVSGGGLARHLRVQNVGDTELQLTGVRLLLPGVCIGRPEACRLEVPATAVRPRLPLPSAARFSEGGAWDREAAPGAGDRWGRAMEDAPDTSPGLLCVHNPDLDWSLRTLHHREREAGMPMVYGTGRGGTLGD